MWHNIESQIGPGRGPHRVVLEPVASPKDANALAFSRPVESETLDVGLQTVLRSHQVNQMHQQSSKHSFTVHWRRKWQSTPVFLPGKTHAQRSLSGCSSWGHKESNMTWWLNTYYPQSTIPALWVHTGLLGFALYFIIYFTLLITAVLWGWDAWSILFLSRDGRTASCWASG